MTTMSIAEVRRKLTKLKLDYPDLVLPVPLCGRGITAEILQKVYENCKQELDNNGRQYRPGN